MVFAVGIATTTSIPALAVTSHTQQVPSIYATSTNDVIRPAARAEELPQSIDVGGTANPATAASESYVVEAPPPPPVAEENTTDPMVPAADSGLVAWPVLCPNMISDPFGPREAPCAGCSSIHDGVDLNSGDGTPVMSVANGIVISSTDAGGGLGVMIEVEHNIGGEVITSLYAHMRTGSRRVQIGDRVTAGQQIGAIGSTGQSTGPHLHLEMYGIDGVRFDGHAWLAARLG